MDCADSRAHEFNTTKRRRHCPSCGYVANSIEVLLPEDMNGQRTDKIAYRMMQAAHGASESDRLAKMLRSLADEMEAA
ncbi:MAG: hypothetical protein ACOC8P_00310 [Dichotomicrobium sp.]